MSTISNLLSSGDLKAVTLGLIDDELADRGLFGTSRVFSFLEQELPRISSQDVALSALEQVANLFGRYLTNRPFILKSPISPIRHLENGVWELKTLDVRVFGWFSAKDVMIVDAGCDVKLLKSGDRNYSGFITQTTYARKRLGFEPNDYIKGSLSNDILSNIVVLPRSNRSPLRGRR
jgi:hypothetical protein